MKSNEKQKAKKHKHSTTFSPIFGLNINCFGNALQMTQIHNFLLTDDNQTSQRSMCKYNERK